MKHLLLIAASDSPDLSLVDLFLGCLVLFFGVAVVVRLGGLFTESKKQTELLEKIAHNSRVAIRATEKQIAMEREKELEQAATIKAANQEQQQQARREKDAAWRKAQE